MSALIVWTKPVSSAKRIVPPGFFGAAPADVISANMPTISANTNGMQRDGFMPSSFKRERGAPKDKKGRGAPEGRAYNSRGLSQWSKRIKFGGTDAIASGRRYVARQFSVIT